MLYIMVGLPGSGKSTYAQKLGLPILSADKIREELYGDAAIQGDGEMVFSILNKRIDKAISGGYSVIIDNTSVSRKARAVFIRKANCTAIFVDTPLDECLRRNRKRERHVSEDVIYRMASNLVPPTKEEGFKEIIVIK